MVRRTSAVFLDRDGVLNKPIIKNYKSYAPTSLKDFKLYPNTKKNCKLLKKKYLLIVVTNQPDYMKKKIPISNLREINDKLYKNIKYDDLYICLDKNKKSFNRKPNPGMLIKAIKKYNINIKKSFLVGDRWSDMEAGKKVGCKTVFIDRGYKERKPNKTYASVKSLSEATKLIMTRVAR